MRQKRLMLLGGLRYLIPVIEAAHNQGYYVITADYLPDNIAHKYSDEYCNVSIIDKEAVLKEAQRLHIDGIMSFACDPGVLAASYVQNKMGLPSFGPYESVEILQNKDKFRAFLLEHGFNAPKAKGYSSVEEAIEDAYNWTYPVIVKPTDAAGSKGVTRVNESIQLRKAAEYAIEKSLSGHLIIEEFIEKVGCSSDTDSFSVDGKLQFVSFNAQRFDADAKNPYTPAAYSWPSTFSEEQEQYLTNEIQRLISLLGMKTCLYNIETRIGINGKPYIMELTPRGGGNRLSEMLRFATGVDLISAIARFCVGDGMPEIKQGSYDGNWVELILHAGQSGLFKELVIDNKKYKDYVVQTDLWVQRGNQVEPFEGANDTIGTLIMNFPTAYERDYAIDNLRYWLKILVYNTV